ncbi:MAG: TlpA family protein disulfide reductase [Chitinophagales bacterium]
MLFGLSIFAESTTVKGKIHEPSAYQYGGSFHQTPIRFYVQKPLESLELVEIPSDLGDFTLTVDLKEARVVNFEYDGQEGQLFLSPNDQLTMRFQSGDVLNSLEFEGKGAKQNGYFVAFNKRFNPQQIERDLQQRKYGGNEAIYRSFCEDLKLKENAFNRNYFGQNNTSSVFQKWVNTETEYRCANRIQAYFFQSPSKQKSNYRSFVANYSLNNSTALIAPAYQKYIENHLRQLVLFDSPELKEQRIINRTSWLIRAFELAKQEFSGKSRDFALAFTLNVMLEGEDMDVVNLYDDFKRYCGTAAYRQVIDAKMAKFTGFLAAPAPTGSNLYVIGNEDSFQLRDLLDRYQGKVIYMDFWASWCGPCLAEMPYSKQVYEQYKNDAIAFVYFSEDKTEGKWRGNINRFGLGGEHYLLSDALKAELYQVFGVQSLPTYVVIDQQGKLINANAPRPSNDFLPTLLDSLLD